MPTSTYKNNSHKSKKRSKSLSKKHKNSKRKYSNKNNNMIGGSGGTTGLVQREAEKDRQELLDGIRAILKKLEKKNYGDYHLIKDSYKFSLEGKQEREADMMHIELLNKYIEDIELNHTEETADALFALRKDRLFHLKKPVLDKQSHDKTTDKYNMDIIELKRKGFARVEGEKYAKRMETIRQPKQHYSKTRYRLEKEDELQFNADVQEFDYDEALRRKYAREASMSNRIETEMQKNNNVSASFEKVEMEDVNFAEFQEFIRQRREKKEKERLRKCKGSSNECVLLGGGLTKKTKNEQYKNSEKQKHYSNASY